MYIIGWALWLLGAISYGIVFRKKGGLVIGEALLWPIMLMIRLTHPDQTIDEEPEDKCR